MTNKELQELLKQYPDDIPIFISQTCWDHTYMAAMDAFKDQLRIEENDGTIKTYIDEEDQEVADVIIITDEP